MEEASGSANVLIFGHSADHHALAITSFEVIRLLLQNITSFNAILSCLAEAICGGWKRRPVLPMSSFLDTPRTFTRWPSTL
jgi:hypothetical protein